MIRKYFVSIVVLLVLISGTGYSQDVHFSQFFSSPLTLNPALTGKFDGDFRLAGNYRNQWPEFNNLYKTFSGSADFQIMGNKIPENDTWGVGIMALRDNAGSNILTDTYLGVSTSYHKALDEDGFQQIGIGFQGTYGAKRLDYTKLYFEDMLTANGFTGNTQEQFNAGNLDVDYFDLNAGILYSGSTTGENNFYVGASVYHINRPKQGFMNAEWTINPRTTIHGGGYFPVADNVKIHASAIAQFQNKASEIVFGGAAAATVADDDLYPTTVFLGSYFRINDAIIPYVALDFKGMRFGASYDINTSSPRSASRSRGGFEFSIIYTHKPNDGGRGLPCPVL